MLMHSEPCFLCRFFEGGVRVMSFVSGPLIPPDRRGTRWAGMAASADWYATITTGIAGGPLPGAATGYRPPDALNLWRAAAASPRGVRPTRGSRPPPSQAVHPVGRLVASAGGGARPARFELAIS
jgi:hypothetical protein